MIIGIIVILLGNMLGLVADQSAVTMESRKIVAQSLALQCTLAAQKNEISSLEKILEAVVDTQPEVLSLGILGLDGFYFTKTKEHSLHWIKPPEGSSQTNHWQVPIHKGTNRWANLEISFLPRGGQYTILGYPISPLALQVIFCAGAFFMGFFIFMRKTLQHLDPSSVMPPRVKYALDTLNEGVLLVDKQDNIVLANTAFAEKMERTTESLVGQKASLLQWLDPEKKRPLTFPWLEAMEKNEAQTGVSLHVVRENGEGLIFIVNGAPILDDKGKSLGAIASFTDVTELENRNTQLSEMLKLLEGSKNEIAQQNIELEYLAMRDPLTGCLNRRAFYRKAQNDMEKIHAEGAEMACIMADIDHFKLINDKYGHAIGDQVIQFFARTFQRAVRDDDAICRYGGEEFCVLLPTCNLERALTIAEKVRSNVAAGGQRAIPEAPGIAVYGSFGVTVASSHVTDVDMLIGRADDALYKAKESGRNRVLSWDGEKD